VLGDVRARSRHHDRNGGRNIECPRAISARSAGIDDVGSRIHLDHAVAHGTRESGDFTRSKGKEVMESFIKAEQNGKNICAVYAHNDDMAIGAIQAIKEAGLKPGSQIKIVSIDGVPDIYKAMLAGEANASVELTPNMAGPAFDALIAMKKDGTQPKKFIQTQSALILPDMAQKEYDMKKNMGY